MELTVIPMGAGKYVITDDKERKIYSVSKKRRLIGNPMTTLHDASGYALYTMVRTSNDLKPAFAISFNDKLFLKAQCKSLYVDPCISFSGNGGNFELKGKDIKLLTVYLDGDAIGEIHTELQANEEQNKYTLRVKDKIYDDFFPLFVVVTDKCFGPKK